MKNGKCPICGKELEKKRGDVKFPTGKRKRVVVKDINYLECRSCREKVFSNDAQVVIEETVYGKRKTRVA